MNKKKYLLWLVISLGIFIAFILLVLITLPHFLDLNFVKSKLNQQLKTRYQIEAQIGSISLRVFPWPRLILKEIKITAKDIQAHLPYVSAYPKLGALLHRRLEIDSITLTKPNLKVSLSHHISNTAKTRSVTKELKIALKKLSALSFTANLKIDDASVEIFKGTTPFIKAEALNLKVNIQHKEILFESNFHSSFCDEVSFKGRADPNSGLKGQAWFKNLKLECLPVSFLSQRIGHTDINLSLTFDFATLEEFQLGFDIKFPCFITNSPALLLQCGFIQGTIFRKKSYLEVNLTKLQLDKPRIKGQGRLVIDSQRPEVVYNFKAQELDITDIRNTALSVFPQHKTVNRIFQIVKGGKAQNFRFSQRAKDLHALKNLKSITLEAQASNARIDIPRVGLSVSNGQGHISIKNGILYGNGLSGVVEGAQVKNGNMAIALSNPPGTLRIKTNFTASLETGLFFLHKFVKSNSVQKELKLISKTQGIVSGQVAINGTTRAVDVNLKGTITGAKVSYQRIPYPAFIDQVSFSYHQKSISFQGLKGHLGHSQVSKATGTIDFSTPLIFLNIKNFSGKLIAQELDPWFKKWHFLRSLYQNFDLTQGELEVIGTRFSYKFGVPASLYYLFNFKLKNGLLFLSFLPDKVHIERGEGLISPALIQFRDVKGALGEDDFFISGEVKDPFTEKRQIRLQGKGKVTALLQDWCYQIGKLPAALKIETPVQVKAFQLNYTPAQTHFEVVLLNSEGIALELNLDYTAATLFVRKLYLSDRGEECFISFYLNWPKRHLDNFNFKGKLSAETLNTLLLKNKYLTGKIVGEINGQIDLMQIGTSNLNGHLFVEGIKDVIGPEGLVINQAQLRASGKVITFSKINLYWQRNIVRAQGKIQFVPNTLVIKGRIFSPFVNWHDFSKLLNSRNKGQSAPFKIKAEVDVQLDFFQYDKFQFEQLNAFIKLKNWQTVEIKLHKVRYCDLDLKGNIKKLPDQVEFNIVFQAEHKNLDNLCYCLTKKRKLFKANYVLTGTLKAKGDKNPLQEDSSGTLSFHSEEGRIYKFTLLARIFSFLNVFEVLKGRLPDLNEEGLYYKYFDLSAQLKLQRH